MPFPTRDDIIYQSTKTYVHAQGLSCAFRQWRADSHCSFIHGYSLEVKLTFSAGILDERNWVVDFGGLKPLKGWLEETFDHTTLVAIDDPDLKWFNSLQRERIIQLRIVPSTGCESFARMIFEYAEQWLIDAGFSPRCQLESVEVREHPTNSAICRRK
jgi:6-pyruvoyltetrahydropterin/6-carboxytetrahydropterin synthase